MKTWPLLLLALLLSSLGTRLSAQAVNMREMVNPMAAADEVWMEEMTVLEIRDAIKAGKTTAIILTGGVEQNGPYLPTGKHNFVLSAMGGPIARRLGNALVAPIITLEPGNINTPSCFGCTFVSAATYRAIMSDMATALRGQGFKNIVFMGDSGGNQNAMRASADSLTAKWAAEPVPAAPQGLPATSNARPARAHFIEAYYRDDIWSCNFLIRIQVFQQPAVCSATRGLYHDDVHYTSIIATTYKGPQRIRHDERMKAGLFSINGVDLAPLERTIALGYRLIDYRADIAARAINDAIRGTGGR
jgi:creatinine amidohydrolase